MTDVAIVTREEREAEADRIISRCGVSRDAGTRKKLSEAISGILGRVAELEAQSVESEKLRVALVDTLNETALFCKRVMDDFRGQRDRAVSDLARATETFTDDAGTVWTVPTAWAYAAACKALKRRHTELDKTRDSLIKIAEELLG